MQGGGAAGHPGAAAWRYIAPLAVPRHALAAVAVGAHVYAVGGWVAGTACTAAVERYDVAADAWAPRAPLLTQGGSASPVLR